MKTWIDKAKIGLAAFALSGTLSLFPHSGLVALADDSKHTQLICDEQMAGAGGVIHYHLIYHNSSEEIKSKVTLKIKIPDGLDIDTESDHDVVWNPTDRIAVWNLVNIKSDGAIVLHFNLKVKESVTVGSSFDLICSTDEDGIADLDTKKCTVQIGDEIDQPFFKGYPDGNFHPHSSITRAEAAAVVARTLNLTNTTPLSNQYSDVPSSHWAFNYITEATNSGYMQGYGDNSFHPDSPISRAELVTLMLKMRGIEPENFDGFDDTKGHWADKDIGTAKALRFIDGLDEHHFNPNQPTERQEAAKLFDLALYRGPLQNGAIPVVQHFPDVLRTAWSFGWIEEGSVTAHQSVHMENGEWLIQYLPDQTKLQ